MTVELGLDDEWKDGKSEVESREIAMDVSWPGVEVELLEKINCQE